MLLEEERKFPGLPIDLSSQCIKELKWAIFGFVHWEKGKTLSFNPFHLFAVFISINISQRL